MRRDIVPVDFFCDALRAVLLRREPGIFNVGSGQAVEIGAVARWMMECFGPKITADKLERADRFVEEALELAQTMPGFSADRAHALVEYVFGRLVGDPRQEVGGVMVTLAALCKVYPVTSPGQVTAAVDAARRAGRKSVLLLVKSGTAPEAFVGIDIGTR